MTLSLLQRYMPQLYFMQPFNSVLGGKVAQYAGINLHKQIVAEPSYGMFSQKPKNVE